MKKLVKTLVVLVVLLVLAGVAGVVFIDQVAKAAVERGGTYAMEVDTQLGSASIGLFSGRFEMSSLEIANPPGFRQPHFLTLAKGEMDLDMGTLRKDTLVVPRFLIDGVTLDLERGKDGTNFGAILDSLGRFESRRKPGEPPPKEEGRKVLIHEIVIRGVEVSVDIGTSIAGFQSTSFRLPELVLTDLGSGGEGKSISEHFSTLLRVVLAAALESGKGLLPPELLSDLESRLAKLGVPIDLDKILDRGLEGIREDVQEAAKDRLEEEKQKLQEEAQKKIEGSKDLLKKKVDQYKGDGSNR